MPSNAYAMILRLLNDDDHTDQLIQLALSEIQETNDAKDRSALLIALTLRKAINGDFVDVPLAPSYVESLSHGDPYKVLGQAVLAYLKRETSNSHLESVRSLAISIHERDEQCELLATLTYVLVLLDQLLYDAASYFINHCQPRTVTNAWNVLCLEVLSSCGEYLAVLENDGRIPREFAVEWRTSLRVLTLLRGGKWDTAVTVVRDSGIDISDELVREFVKQGYWHNIHLHELENLVDASSSVRKSVRALFHGLLTIQNSHHDAGIFELQSVVVDERDGDLLIMFFEVVAMYQGPSALSLEIERERERYGTNEVLAAVERALQSENELTTVLALEDDEGQYDPIIFWTTYHRIRNALHLYQSNR